MNETLDYLRTFAVFPFALRRFMASAPLTLAEAQRIVRERMAQRESNFLRLVEHGVYGWPASPYLPLLRQAGCDMGDVRALVKQHGLEGALGKLHEAGVYVTFEEFKGRQPVKRGAVELPVANSDFDNPLAKRELMVRTGGSTGAAHAVGVDLDNVADRSTLRLVALGAHGLNEAPTGNWNGILPTNTIYRSLFGAYIGNIPKRWFSPFGLRDSRQWVKYGLGTYYLILCTRLAGMKGPWPEFPNRNDQALEIARWAVETVKSDGQCLINAGVSRGVRLALAAQAAGLDLTGVTIMGAGEPPTPAKVGSITGAGAHYIPTYGMSDAGLIGSGCVCPADITDMHVFKDAMALTTHPHWVENFGLSVPALTVTTLLPTTSKLLLNVESDDYGIVEERSCGCELETFGYSTHLRQVRSYSKLTGEGVTLIGNEIQRILEEVLPARFGGSPLDYQLLEDEDAQGFTKLYLLIDPRVTHVDERAVIDCLLDNLGRSSPMADSARLIWQRMGTLAVRRAEPVWSGRGKLLPLHVAGRGRKTSD